MRRRITIVVKRSWPAAAAAVLVLGTAMSAAAAHGREVVATNEAAGDVARHAVGTVEVAGHVAEVLALIDRAIGRKDPVTLDWKAMAALNYRTGEMPETLRRLNGVTVRIPGFMVPLEDTETRVTEFLLVPYFGACIHTPPPPPNQMAHVLMQRNQSVDVNLWDPIWIIGTLKIENVESPYGMVGFQVTGERILPYDG